MLRGDMVEPGEHAGERSGEARNPIGEDRQAEGGEALRRAIGVEREADALGREPANDMLEDRGAADLDQRLVDAAHAPRLSAGENDPEAMRHSSPRRSPRSEPIP